MTPNRFEDHVGRIMTLAYGGAANHAVASHCDRKGNFRFFDPNGGIMDFGNTDDAYINMQSWIEKELKKATSDNYDKMQMVTVNKFIPAGSGFI